MDKDLQKPILYKCDPRNYVQIELLKESMPINRNRLINSSVYFYLDLIKKLRDMEDLNEVTWNQANLQKFLFQNLREIQIEYKIRRPRAKKND